MRRTIFCIALGGLFLIAAIGCEESMLSVSAKEQNSLSVEYLRCEYLVDPVGLDVIKPRFSWILDSEKRSQVQSAYRILVASSEKKLAKDTGDLWDTGRIDKDRMNQIAYDGKELKSHQQCFWKVMAWDGEGKASAWSKPAAWSMGLLEEGEFAAKWIGFDKSRDRSVTEPDVSLEGARWIWYPDTGDNGNMPLGQRYFRKKFTIPAGKKITSAWCAVSGDNEYKLFVNSRRTRDGNSWEEAIGEDIKGRLIEGENILAIEGTNVGEGPNPAGICGALKIEFEEGQPLVIMTDESWVSHNTGSDDWMHPEKNIDEWVAVKVLGEYGISPWQKRAKVTSGTMFIPPVQYLRKEFSLEKEPIRVVLYSSALGLYEAEINGKAIGNDYFRPGWTDYDKRVYYQAYDVTDIVGKGDNAIGVMLADGWYSGYLAWGRIRDHYGKNPRFAGQLHVMYKDGSSEVIASDETWKASTGPIVEGDFLMGEVYDARKKMPGWARAGYDDSRWSAVDLTEEIGAKIEAYPTQPVKKFQEIKPKSITEPSRGAFVYDMGTNFAGFVRLKVNGQSGQKVVLRFAERLNPDGTIYVTNLRSARATDTYICAGGGEEVWQPRFTFHGFQYVEVSGIDKPDMDTITGIELTSATPVAGSFECNDAQANQLYHNICQTQRANFIEVPTDCPQRDERLGWMGDAQIYVRTATNNTDVSAFFTKWLVDVEDAQKENGEFADVSPRKGALGGGVAAWGDAGVICPWTIYQVYGDKRVLEEHYDAMVKWVEFCKETTNGTLLRPASGYGDWLSINADTPKDVLATAYFAYSAYLTGQTALEINKFEEYQKYNGLFNEIKKAFNKAYVGTDGRIKGDTQTVYVLAIAFNLLSQDNRALAEKYLVEDIEKKGWLISTGFVGTKDLMMTLYKIGRLDVAYRLFHNDAFPSWGFSIKHGATSIWERWDGWTPENGFQNPGMNSFAHYSFGAVGEWMFKTIGGIDIMNPGYKKLWIRPRPGGNITWAKVNHDSIRGRVGSEWKLEDGVFTLKATVPQNTVGIICVPVVDEASVSEKGNFEGAKFLRMEDGAAVYRVEGGTFEFTSKGVKGIEMVE